MKRYITFWAILLLFFICQNRAGCKSSQFYYEFKGGVDEKVWEKGQYSFSGNLSAFWPANVKPGSDYVSLTIEQKTNPTLKEPYTGAQLMSKQFFSYGKFTVRMRAPIVPGTVGSFFLMNRWQPGHWLHKEIDIEFLGKDRHLIQYNVHRFYNDTESAIGKPYVIKIPNDYGAAFHEYSIVWTKNKIEWLIDGQKTYENFEKIPNEPLAIIMNAWVPDPSWGTDWVGPLDPSVLPCRAEYAWVKYEPF